MNNNPSLQTSIYKHSQTFDKKFLVVLQRLIKILLKYAQNYSHIPHDQKYQKDDFLYKILDYFMLQVDHKVKEEKYKTCQKYAELKTILLNYLKITPELLEFLCEKVVHKINKGKFHLSMVLHLSKNISKSKSFDKSQTETVKKTEWPGQQEQEKGEEKKIKNQFKVKRQMPTFDDEKQFVLQNNVRQSYQNEEIAKGKQDQLNQQKLENQPGLWSSYIEQQYNHLFFPQYYYYSMLQ